MTHEAHNPPYQETTVVDVELELPISTLTNLARAQESIPGLTEQLNGRQWLGVHNTLMETGKRQDAVTAWQVQAALRTALQRRRQNNS